MDFKKFRKTKENGEIATLRHPDGHEISVAKKALNPRLKKQLSELPLCSGGEVQKMSKGGKVQKFDDGGGVLADQPAYEAPMAERIGNSLGDFLKSKAQRVSDDIGLVNSQIVQPVAHTIGQFGHGVASGLGIQPDQEEVSAAPQPDQPGVQQAQNAPDQAPQGQSQDPFGGEAYGEKMKNAYDLEHTGIEQKGQAEADLGNRQADILDRAAKAEAARDANNQKNWNTLNQERMALLQDYKNGHINPNHYQESMGSGQKVATAIGLLLGGIGGGASGQGNPAMDFLNKQIERDIESQKANLGKTNNLLEANYRQFGNLRDAADMTRVAQATIVGDQIKSAMARSQSPLAQAAGNKALGELDAKYAPIMSQLAIRRSLSQPPIPLPGQGMQRTSNGQPQQPQYDPAMRIRQMSLAGILPEKEKSEALKELGEAQQLEKLRADVEKSASDMHGRAFNGAFNKSARESDKNTFGGVLAKLSEGRFNLEESKNQMEALLPSAGDVLHPSNIQLKAQHRKEFFDSLMKTPTLDQYGIKVPSHAMQPQAQPQERMDKATGQISLFDPNTRQFLGYKK